MRRLILLSLGFALGVGVALYLSAREELDALSTAPEPVAPASAPEPELAPDPRAAPEA